MTNTAIPKLYRLHESPGHLVAEDGEDGMLMRWPAKPGGWGMRAAIVILKRDRAGLLEEVPIAEARGTGWPHAPTGRRPRAGVEAAVRKVSIRVTGAELEEWTAAAGGRSLSDWARGELTAAARRTR